MNVRVFNLCLLVGWLMVLAGGVVVNPGWGIAIAGGLLIALTLAATYIAGWESPAPNATATEPESL